MNVIINFFNHPFFIIVGGVTTVTMILVFLYSLYLIIKGVLPVWIRLGYGLSKRKIAIFSKDDQTSLKDLFLDSKLFNAKNIICIHKNSLEKAQQANIFLVHWKDFQDQIDTILAMKKDNIGLVVYAPPNEGRIDNQDLLNKINSKRNSLLVNYRGRLLNDIIVLLISVSYDK
jgi:hypothetical protein